MEITATPLTAAAFAPYGDVLAAPVDPGRVYFPDAIGNGRPSAALSLSLSRLTPVALPLRSALLERHAFSSQTFLPLSVSRYLVIVAPPAPDGGPDAGAARAFVAQAGQGITYRAGTWHHGMTVLDRGAEFAVVMWRDGTAADEEFVTLPGELVISVPAPASPR
jgi:ureidoglycolate lyase